MHGTHFEILFLEHLDGIEMHLVAHRAIRATYAVDQILFRQQHRFKVR